MRTRNIWTEEEINVLKKFNILVSINELCELLPKHTKSSIENKLRNFGFKQKYIWTKNEIQFLVDNYQKYDINDFYKYYNKFSKSSIQAQSNRLQLYKTKEELFLNDSNINAHFWGLIMSDGSFKKDYSIYINLKHTDEEYLNNVIKNYNLKTYKYITPQNYEYVSFIYSDRENNIKLMNKLQASHRKTYEPPSDISFLTTKELFLSFLVGFIDGDGCVNVAKYNKYNSIKIGVHSNWRNIFNLIGEKLKYYFDIETKIYHYPNKKNIVILTIPKANQLLKLKEEVDKLNIPYMKRKWDKIIPSNLTTLEV